jgi:hypothetical protein
MTTDLLLERFSEQRVSLSLDGADLLVCGPTIVITPEVTVELQRNKAKLVAALMSKSDRTSVRQLVHERGGQLY